MIFKFTLCSLPNDIHDKNVHFLGILWKALPSWVKYNYFFEPKLRWKWVFPDAVLEYFRATLDKIDVEARKKKNAGKVFWNWEYFQIEPILK